ncbi:hypothetical protein GCM10010123_32720 [Pilimelia anulata]|uniref:histidine kinase n=1 Tax=Pilimelia anulata TaxID=53371 RepID=A0A8J3BDF8_9ACTN|nr:histidine kinase [Pilimelia anulata]GGK00274.1 hypothetical protein GCM10010123_32720 [Pilimelia anulata]
MTGDTRRHRWTDAGVIAACTAVDLLVWWATAPAGSARWAAALAAPAAFLTLAARHARPGAVLAVQLGYATAAPLLLPGYATVAGVVVAVHAAAARWRPRAAAAAALAGLLPLAAQAAAELRAGAAPGAVGPPALLQALLLAVAAGVGHRAWQADARAAAAAAAHRDAAAGALRAERLRIARELHDIVAHAVTAMLLQAAGARARLGDADPPTAAALDAIRSAGQQATQELRRMLRLLRSAGADDAPPAGSPGPADIDRLVAECRAAGLAVTADTDGPPGAVDPSVGLAAYRVVQEALTNCMKHAGPGTAVRVRLAWRPGVLTVTVADRGGAPGAAAASGRTGASGGLGLVGLRERVRTVGGTLAARPGPDGFTVTAVLPAAAAPVAAGVGT